MIAAYTEEEAGSYLFSYMTRHWLLTKGGGGRKGSSIVHEEPLTSVADPQPGFGIRCLFDPWIRDPRWVKNQDPDPRPGSGMNNPDHVSESLETKFLG